MDDHKDSYMYAPPGPGLLQEGVDGGLRQQRGTSLLSSNSAGLRGNSMVNKMLNEASGQTTPPEGNIDRALNQLTKSESKLDAVEHTVSTRNRL